MKLKTGKKVTLTNGKKYTLEKIIEGEDRDYLLLTKSKKDFTFGQHTMKGIEEITDIEELEYIKSFLHLESPELRYYVMYGVVYDNEFSETPEVQPKITEDLDELINLLTEYDQKLKLEKLAETAG